MYMKKLYILAIFALFVGSGMVVTRTVRAEDLFTVTSCEQVGSDIRISRDNGPKKILTSSCRDAGYGMRLYKMTCASSTQYRVEWSTPFSCTNQQTNTQDGVAPSVSLVTNKSNVGNAESVTLTATANDVRGVTKIEIREGSNVVRTCTNTTVCTHTFTSASQQVVERFQTFTARAYDAAGNVGYSSGVTIRTYATGDTTKPEATLVVNKTNVLSGEQIVVTATASDASGISKIEMYRNGTRVQTCFDTSSCVHTLTPTLPSWVNNRIYKFYARVTDKNNNIQTSVTREVTVRRNVTTVR